MAKSKILKPNPALEQLEILAGNWDMELSNASFLPDPSASTHSKASFEWVEDGAYLAMRQGNRDSGPPFATWTISRDEAAKEYVILYYDDRNVSRIYRMSFDRNIWKIWRDSPGFSQRFTGRISENGRTIKASWEKSTDGKTWEHDFDLTYTR